MVSAQRAADGEVQLPDCESGGTGGGRSRRRRGLGPADRAGAEQKQTRPLSHVLPRRTPAAPGGDGTETQPVKTHTAVYSQGVNNKYLRLFNADASAVFV